MIVQAPAYLRHPRTPPPPARPRWKRDDATGRFERRDAPITFDSPIRSPRPRPLPVEPEIPDLIWPPWLPEREPVRGRPERRDALWRAVAAQTRAQARAVLLVAHDLLANHRRVRIPTRGPGYLIERCARYYSAGGDLGHTEAQAALDVVLHQLRATPITVAELNHFGIPTRNTRGRAHAQHWWLTAGACDDLAHVLAMLSAYGIRRPPAARKMRALADAEHHLNVTAKGQRWWSVCPAHADTDPSLLLNPDGSAYCFGGCGLVGRWVDADRDGWAPMEAGTPRTTAIPGTALFRAFRDPEAMTVPGQVQPRKARRAGEGKAGKGDDATDAHGKGAAWTAAQAGAHAGRDQAEAGTQPAPASASPANQLTPPGFYVCESEEVEGGSFDLGLRRVRAYSRLRAAEAGQPGEHPGMCRSETGRRLVVAKMAQTEVWGRTLSEPEPVQYQDCRPWGIVLAKRSSRGMRRAYAKSLDLLSVLASADRACRGPKSHAKAAASYEVVVGERQKWGGGTPDKDILPDLFVSLDHHEHTRFRNGFDREVKEIRDPSGHVCREASILTIVSPDGFGPLTARWVGVDVDDILIPWTTVEGESDASDAFPLVDQRGGPDSYGDERLKVAAGKIQDLVQRHPLFTGRVGLVRTGPRGVQVVAELETSRWRTGELWQDLDFRAMVQNLSDRVLVELRAVGCDGGKVDPSAMASGRYFRRPGWRVAKDGSLFRARLIFSSP